jgi:hypothetical protein
VRSSARAASTIANALARDVRGQVQLLDPVLEPRDAGRSAAAVRTRLPTWRRRRREQPRTSAAIQAISSLRSSGDPPVDADRDPTRAPGGLRA